MEAQYKKKGAILDLYNVFEFDSEADAVTLDIPVKGITIKGWAITPQMLPVVSHCVAIAICTIIIRPTSCTELWHVINLNIPSLVSIPGD